MRNTIFHNTEEVPLQSNDPEVVRTALTMKEARRDMMPASWSPNAMVTVWTEPARGVRNLDRPRRGHGY